MTVRVVVADDHPAMRAGVVALLGTAPDLDVVGEAADGDDALALIARLRPHVAVLDLRMPVLDGVAATRRIVAEHPATRVLMLTTYDTDNDIERAIAAGALGYLLKDAGRDQLTAAVRAAARGETTLAPTIATRLITRRRITLSPREVDVLLAVADGLSNPDIGRRLHITEATVKTHLLRAFAKLNVNDRTAAVVSALQRGLLPHRDG
ncbi:response regulator [Actinokineospora cianjurensis]|uniref:LuxR family two component transcriptional regulator n=1 Tax=Actinokineospora cianjurensis TaxID=585224 RepID=A0A421BBW4_9PSEU|nr:response regulator transcription factor [Actinokineospora cianjurensis]RLK61838.1 LuxR family two component transcriptional regulator [Actinokineospora cianjurensis]